MLLVSFTIHELSHAYVSYRLGDPTPRNQGRLTLNPLKHLDILGTLMLLLYQFGWAKPVNTNPTYYRDRKKGVMLVSIAGPLSNVLLALLFAFPLIYIRQKYGDQGLLSFSPTAMLYNLSYFFYSININLAVFNILPVPPLDGSKILSGILPSRYYFKLMEYENYTGLIFLVVMFAFPSILTTILSPFQWVVVTAIKFIVNPIMNMLV